MEPDLTFPSCAESVAKSIPAMERARVLELQRFFQAASVTRNEEARAPGQNVRHPPDATLTALAQLGCFRLDCNRSFVSLIDSCDQYIIGEATKSVSVSRSGRHKIDDGLYLGFSSHPLDFGVCPETILIFTSDSADTEINTANITADRSRYIIRDFTLDTRFSTKPYVAAWPYMRSYAEVPLTSSSGFVIGSYCVIDDKPRAFHDDDVSTLIEIASTIMNHLELRKDQLEKDRAVRLVHGLSSYLEEGMNIHQSHPGTLSTAAIATTPVARKRDTDVPWPRSLASLTDTEPNNVSSTNPAPSSNGFQDPVSRVNLPDTYAADQHFPWNDPDHYNKASQGQDFKAPSTNKHIPSTNDNEAYSKAGTIICQAMNLQGLAFLNADFNSHSNSAPMFPSNEPISESQGIDSSCSLLSYSTSDVNDPSHGPLSRRFANFSQKLLQKLLTCYPFGHLFCFDQLGSISSHPMPTDYKMAHTSRLGFSNFESRGGLTDGSILAAELATFIGPVCSIIILPLWNFQQERWAAAAIGWVTEPTMVLKKSDLGYLTAFGNSIMTEVLNQQATALSSAKSNFIASISHELRSPLHGILACIELLRETIPFNSDTSTMLDNANSCGAMLLDTMNHLLDFAKINRLAVNRSEGSKLSKGNDTAGDQVRLSATNLWKLVEEVIEGLHIGFLAQSRQDDDISTTKKLFSSPEANRQDARNDVVILLDIDPSAEWEVCTEVGAWKRIVMNLVGNALKYTSRGYIKIQLKFIDMAQSGSSALKPDKQILLQVSDTGRGMSTDYLKHKLFKPFAQESNLSAGLGLGLYIVQQLANSLDGTISIQSEPNVGTSIAVQVPFGSKTQANLHLSPHQQSVPLLDPEKRLLGREIVLSIPDDCADAAGNLIDEDNTALKRNSVSQTLTSIAGEWLGMKVSPAIQREQTSVGASGPLLPLLKLSSSDGRIDAPWVLQLMHQRVEDTSLAEEVHLPPGTTQTILRHPFGPTKVAVSFLQALDTWATTPSPSPAPTAEPTLGKRSEGKNEQGDKDPPIPPLQQALRSNTNDAGIEEMPPHTNGKADDTVTTAKDTDGPISRNTSTLKTNPLNVKATGYKHLLLVDDNDINLKILASCVKREGCTFDRASNGQEALDLFRASEVPFDLILMDISMPVMDGCTAARGMRAFEQQANLSRTPMIALTALGSDEARQQVSASGFDAFVTKPVSLKEIRNLLKPQGG